MYMYLGFGADIANSDAVRMSVYAFHFISRSLHKTADLIFTFYFLSQFLKKYILPTTVT